MPAFTLRLTENETKREVPQRDQTETPAFHLVRELARAGHGAFAVSKTGDCRVNSCRPAHPTKSQLRGSTSRDFTPPANWAGAGQAGARDLELLTAVRWQS